MPNQFNQMEPWGEIISIEQSGSNACDHEQICPSLILFTCAEIH